MDSSNPPPPPAPSPSPVPIQRNWWQRNWKWFVPTGCLTLIACFAIFVVGICVIVFGAMKSSDAYKVALNRAKTDQRVVEAIGSPIHEGWLVSGKTNVTGGSGEADISIPIHGPKGEAKIYAVATKSAGRWHYSKLVVEVADTGQRIDLNRPTDEE